MATKTQNQYHRVSSAAAVAERSGHWKQASKLWVVASLCASLPVNQEWADSRQGFCINALARGWEQNNDRERV